MRQGWTKMGYLDDPGSIVESGEPSLVISIHDTANAGGKIGKIDIIIRDPRTKTSRTKKNRENPDQEVRGPSGLWNPDHYLIRMVQ